MRSFFSTNKTKSTKPANSSKRKRSLGCESLETRIAMDAFGMGAAAVARAAGVGEWLKPAAAPAAIVAPAAASTVSTSAANDFAWTARTKGAADAKAIAQAAIPVEANMVKTLQRSKMADAGYHSESFGKDSASALLQKEFGFTQVFAKVTDDDLLLVNFMGSKYQLKQWTIHSYEVHVYSVNGQLCGKVSRDLTIKDERGAFDRLHPYNLHSFGLTRAQVGRIEVYVSLTKADPQEEASG